MDLQAFTQRILPVQGRLFRLAQMFLRNREEAEDATQDVLLRLWSNRDQLERYESTDALAVQMTKNLCLDKLKSHQHQKVQDNADLSVMQAADHAPDRQLESRETGELIARLMAGLPEQYKLVLHLRDVEEYSFEEIEEMTGLSNANIRTTLSRARRRLREDYLKENNHGTGY